MEGNLYMAYERNYGKEKDCELEFEKEAKELFNSFKQLTDLGMIHLSEKGTLIRDKNAKRCALLCINKQIELCKLMDGGFSFEKELERLYKIKEYFINL